MSKPKNLMMFNTATSAQRMADILVMLWGGARMTKHDVALRLDVVHRTSQTYLAELARRGKIHIADYRFTRQNGGSPSALWAFGPAPEGHDLVAHTPRNRPRKPPGPNNRPRRPPKDQFEIELARRRKEIPIPCRDAWQVAFWGKKGMARNESTN